jgi:hypothetical protein
VGNELFFNNVFEYVYPITEDDKLMRKSLNDQIDNVGRYFDLLRKEYRLRRELNNYQINAQNLRHELIDLLKILRLNIH